MIATNDKWHGYKIIRWVFGFTGEKIYQTEDGRWWTRWDGVEKTGQEVRTKKNNHIV